MAGQKKTSDKANDIGKIGPYAIEDLVKQYEFDLYQDFLPFLEKFVIDHERGGFMTNVDRDGKLHNTVKNTWYCGRGIWVYSFLYNNLKREQRYLDIAEKSAKFILRHEPQSDKLWAPEFTKEGEPIQLEGQFIGGKYYPVNEEVSGDLFIANALGELSWALGDSGYWNKAKEIIFKCVRIFDKTDYAPNAAQVYLGKEAPSMPGARIMGVNMLLLNITTQMLAHKPDPDLEKLSDRCIDRILNHHYNPDYDLLNEVLNYDYSRATNEYADLVYTGHGIETIWMLI